MVEIISEESELLAEGLAGCDRGVFQGVEREAGEADLHRRVDLGFLTAARRSRFASMDAMSSPAVSNGP